MLSDQPRVDLVNREKNPLSDFSDVFVRMIYAAAPALREDSASHAALLLLVDALAQYELLEHLHSTQSQPWMSSIRDRPGDARRDKMLFPDFGACRNRQNRMLSQIVHSRARIAGLGEKLGQQFVNDSSDFRVRDFPGNKFTEQATNGLGCR